MIGNDTMWYDIDQYKAHRDVLLAGSVSKTRTGHAHAQFKKLSEKKQRLPQKTERGSCRIHGEYGTKLRNAAVRTGDSATDRRWGNRTPAQEEVGEAAVAFLNTRFGRVKPLVTGAFQQGL